MVSDASPGMEALLGRLRVCVASPPSEAFELKPGHPTVSGVGPRPMSAEITAPGATIGRGTDADLRLVGPASEDVSRRHLLVRASGRQWTVTDCGSENHTYEEDVDSRSWREVASDFPIPVSHGLMLLLGPELLLRFELLAVPVEGRTTARRGPGSRVGAQRIRPPALEEVAALLLSLRRANARDRRVPSIAVMESTLCQSHSTVYRRLKALRELDEVAPLLTGEDPSQTADALELAFPYLLAASPLDRA